MMRIITGSARGTKLVSLEGVETRPTSERAKEAVFSMLAFEIADREVLDLFSGSGQLALEALSRGAAHATLVDSSPAAIRVIRQNVEKTHMQAKATVIQSDCETFLNRASAEKPYDLIFIDPPYAKRLVPAILETLLKRNLISSRAVLVCESEEDDIFEGHDELRAGFDIRKKQHYAKAVVTILDRKFEEGESVK